MDQSLSRRLRALRGERGQREIAAAAGISVSWLSDLERGKADAMVVKTARKLAAALGVSLAELVDPENGP